MDFKFNRQTSKDFLFKKSESLKSSISSGASGVRNGLFGGFSALESKFDKISTKISSSLNLDDENDGEDYLEEKQRLLSEQQRQKQTRERVRQMSTSSSGAPPGSTNTPSSPDPTPPSAAQNYTAFDGPKHPTDHDQTTTKPAKQKPPKPPLPKQLSRGSIDLNGSVHQDSSEDLGNNKQHTKKKIPAPNREELNFNEPLHGETQQTGVETYLRKNNELIEQSDADRNPSVRANNPFSDIASEASAVFEGIHKLHNNAFDLDIDIDVAPVVPDLMQRRRTNPFIDMEDDESPIQYQAEGTEHTDTNRSAQKLDLLPGIPRVPSNNNTELLNPAANHTVDLLAITPTSGAALPLPCIAPIPAQSKHTMDGGEQYEIYDDSDADSVATEGCDEVPEAEDILEPEEAEMLRSDSGNSDASWGSGVNHLDAKSRECMNFMKDYTNKIFDARLSLSPVDKAKFGQICQHESGQLWFSRFINSKRVNNQKVSEQTFFQLVQYFAVVLFECNEHEDYRPAKTLMNMCFTFYHEAEHPTGPPHKHYLYSYLKDQPIWQSLKFWNAAYFDAILVERCRPVPKEAVLSGDDREYQRNITFGQLGTFTSNMRSFGLSKELCLEFLRKQSVVANLTDGQTQILRENIERTPDSTYSFR